MFKRLKRIMVLLSLLLTPLVNQSCSTPKQAVAPQPPTITAAGPNDFIVFYDSDPPGAALYELEKTGKAGETPFWATYQLTEKELREGKIIIDPVRVMWPSGATASNHPGIIFDLKKGREQKYVFVRPDVPGHDADYDAGLKRLMHRFTYGEQDSR